MSIGLLFWILMILWIVSWFGTRFGPYASSGYVYISDFFFFVLLFLLGWHAFGFILHA